MSKLAQIKIYNNQVFTSNQAYLTAYDPARLLVDSNFNISRVFTVSCQYANTLRGQHAHYQCQQILIASLGSILVTCTDGKQQSKYLLSSPAQALFVPAGIWLSQLYKTVPSMLMVLCDKPYDESDYIRNWQQYLTYTANNHDNTLEEFN